MLVLPFHDLIIAILLLLVLCSAAENASSNTSNSYLYDMIPDCAKDCVDNFIKSEYTPTECTSPSNIKCLCRTNTSSGLTLGEAALSCVLSLCSQAAIANSKAYQICDAVSDALPKTHQTLTATVFADVSTTIIAEARTTTERTLASSTLTTEHTLETSLITSTTAPTLAPTLTSTLASTLALTSTASRQTSEITIDDASPSVSSTNPTGSTTESAVPSSASSENPNEKGDHAISPATVIGVSVASGVAGSFLIVVAVFFCCKRWRRKHQEQTNPHVFEIGGAMSEPYDFSKPTPRLPTGGSGPGSSYSLASGHDEMSQQPHTFQPMATVRSSSPHSPQFAAVSHSSQINDPREQERIGFAISSDSDWETSPRTHSSQHSVARLIPDSTVGLYPKPLKWSHRPSSGETLFEEDESQQAAAAAAAAGMVQNNSPRLGFQPKLAGLPSNPRAFKEGFPADNFNQRPGPSSRLAPPFNPDPTFRTSSTDSGAAPNEPSESCSSTNPNTLLAAPIHITQTQNRSLSPGRQVPQSNSTQSSHLPPGSEIVSRPRIVRGNDIKRVQIRSSPRPPSEVIAPYCPDDLWLERGRALAPPKPLETSGNLPYPSDCFPGAVDYPDSPKRKAVALSNRVSPTSRNLTPSRRGDDLILRVD